MATRATRTPRFDSLEQEVFLSLWRTYDRLKLMEEELFNKHGLTAQQYNALRLLRAASPQKIPTLTLAGKLISRAPDITRMMDRLGEKGLIERERLDGDRRTVLVGISESGLAMLDQIASEVRDCHRRQLGHLDKTELRALTDLLRKARRPHESPTSNWS